MGPGSMGPGIDILTTFSLPLFLIGLLALTKLLFFESVTISGEWCPCCRHNGFSSSMTSLQGPTCDGAFPSFQGWPDV